MADRFLQWVDARDVPAVRMAAERSRLGVYVSPEYEGKWPLRRPPGQVALFGAEEDLSAFWREFRAIRQVKGA